MKAPAMDGVDRRQSEPTAMRLALVNTAKAAPTARAASSSRSPMSVRPRMS